MLAGVHTRVGSVAIPTKIAFDNKFEARYFEDMLVNRRLIGKHKDDIILSKKSIILYRYRNSGINSSKPTIEKYTSFLNEMKKILEEEYNTYRFNIQEIYQYYYMWKKHLKGFDESQLPKTKWIYKYMFKTTGTLIRILRIETLVYGRGKKNAFD